MCRLSSALLIAHVLGLSVIIMEILPNYDIELFVIPRFEEDGKIISAKTVRKAIEDKNMDLLKKMVPKEAYSIIKNKYINI